MYFLFVWVSWLKFHFLLFFWSCEAKNNSKFIQLFGAPKESKSVSTAGVINKEATSPDGTINTEEGLSQEEGGHFLKTMIGWMNWKTWKSHKGRNLNVDTLIKG